jgi:hypothetical protein
MTVQDLLEYLLKYPRDAEILLWADPDSEEKVPLESIYDDAKIGSSRMTATKLYLVGEEKYD